MDVAVVQLPVTDGGSNSPLLRHRLDELRGKTLSVRVDRCGVDQLPQLLATQQPEAVVLSSRTRLSARDVQRLTEAAFRYCRAVTVVGLDAGFGWGDHISVRVHGAVRSFCFLDATTARTTPPGHLVLFGQLHQLRHLTVTGDAHVHLAGQVRRTWRTRRTRAPSRHLTSPSTPAARARRRCRPPPTCASAAARC